MIDVAIGMSEVMNLQSRRVFADILCPLGAPVMEFVFWELLLMRQLNILTPVVQSPRGERVEFSPYLIAVSI